MVNEKLLNKINKTFENHIFSVQSDFLRMDQNMTVDFKLKILGTRNMFWMGIEKEYITIEISLPFNLNGDPLKDRVFTIMYMGLSDTKNNLKDFQMFQSISKTIQYYVQDVLSWFGIENTVNVDKITLITQ
jgi:hypothetical protein